MLEAESFALSGFEDGCHPVSGGALDAEVCMTGIGNHIIKLEVKGDTLPGRIKSSFIPLKTLEFHRHP